MAISFEGLLDDEPTRPRSDGNMWALDAALLAISLINLVIVSTFLKFDDPRLLYNAWTYLVAVPLVLIALSFVLRLVANRFVERTMQVACLTSVGLHLILLVCSLKVVVFASASVDPLLETTPEPKKELKQAIVAQYFESSRGASASRPDYLKPVETEHSATELPSDTARREHLAQSEHADISTVDRSPDKTLVPYEIPKAEAMPSQPTISAAAEQFQRQQLTEPSLDRNQKIDTPAVPEISSNPSTLAPRDIALAPSLSETTTPALPSAVPLTPPDSMPSEARLRQPAAAPRASSPSLPEIRATEPTLSRATSPLPSSIASQIDLTGIDSSAVVSPNPAGSLQPGDSDEVPRRAIGRGAPAASGPLPLNDDVRRLASPSPTLRPAQRSGAGSQEAALQSSLTNAPGTGTSEAIVPSNVPRSTTPGPGALTGGKIDVPGSVDAGSMDQRSVGSAPLAPSSLAETSPATRARTSASPGVPSALDLASGSQPFAAPTLDIPRAGLSRTPRSIDVPDIRPSDLPAQRFQRSDVGGPTLAGNSVPIPAPAFQQRVDRNKDGRNEGNIGPLGPETEEAIERGLKFLAAHQRRDGSWHLEDFDANVQIRSDTAATALAILAFQGAGYSHRQFQYEPVLFKAIDFLVRNQRPNGDLYIRMNPASDQNAWLYSHAIASLALCEAYGMTQDEALREPAQRAVNFMVTSQDPSAGGWRYTPGSGSDTSVTGWFMMALKSAQLAGLNVPNETFARIKHWLDQSRASDRQPFLYRYNYLAPDTDAQRHGRVPTPTMTSVGLLMRLYFDWTRDTPEMQRGADYLLSVPPTHGTAANPKRDTYYWYYSTQVLFHMGGERWEKWNGQLRPLLLRTQVTAGLDAGSWDPNGDVPDAWSKFGGRLYVTTLNLLSLEVYYRHLPLYEATAK